MSINYIQKIQELYAFVSVDEGGEGVIGQTCVVAGKLTFMPFVCADKERMEILKPVAKHIAEEMGRKVRLIKLSGREELEEYGFDSSPEGSE